MRFALAVLVAAWGCGTAGCHWLYEPANVEQDGPVVDAALPDGPPIDAPPRVWRAVAAGMRHTCALTNEGELWCWGDNHVGQLGPQVGAGGPLLRTLTPVRVVVDGQETFGAITANENYTCAQAADDVYCWGQRPWVARLNLVAAKLNVGSAKIAAMDGGPDHLCVATDDGVWCAGNNRELQLGVTGTERSVDFVQVIGTAGKDYLGVGVGTNHSCALARSGQLTCWGSDAAGQLGNGGVTGLQATPQAVPGLWLAVAAGGANSCGIRDDNMLYCWGAAGHEQLPGSNAIAPSPQKVDDSSYSAVAMGQRSICALASDKRLFCWGFNGMGEIGTLDDGMGVPGTNQPSAIDGQTFDAMTFGDYHMCAVAQTQIFCTGAGVGGQLGVDLDAWGQPLTHGAPIDYAAVMARGDNMCGLATDNKLYCWGSDLPNIFASAGPRKIPIEVRDQVTTAALGETAVCYVRAGARVCAGNNASGVFGNGNIGLGNQRTQLTLHGCGFSGGTLYCWGRNVEGQIGNGTMASTPAPQAVPVLTGTGYDSLATPALGRFHTCAITTSMTATKRVACWGRSVEGQLGDGLNTMTPNDFRASPAATVDLPFVAAQVVAGGTHTCAWNSQSVACWGENRDGQVGVPITPMGLELAPKTVTLAAGIATVVAGARHTCALTTGAKVFCWGDNDYGQLGIGLAPDQAAPVAALPDRSFDTLVAGGNFTCGHEVGSGKWWCWGDNFFGQFGGGNSWRNSFLPTGF